MWDAKLSNCAECALFPLSVKSGLVHGCCRRILRAFLRLRPHLEPRPYHCHKAMLARKLRLKHSSKVVYSCIGLNIICHTLYANVWT